MSRKGTEEPAVTVNRLTATHGFNGYLVSFLQRQHDIKRSGLESLFSDIA